MLRQDGLRESYAELPDGRDSYMVRVVGEWIDSVLRGLKVTQSDGRGGRQRVIDVGCGEQPFRQLVEERGGRYVGFDIDQNSHGSVDIIGFIDQKLLRPPGWTPTAPTTWCCARKCSNTSPIPEIAFANLRALVAPGGKVVMTAPFVFPLHMEPVDFHRFTMHAIEQYALKHDFVVDACVKLGHPADVLATLLDDMSFLPAEDSLASRLAVRVLRVGRSAFRALLQTPAGRRLVRVSSNAYLSNGVILSPRTSAAAR